MRPAIPSPTAAAKAFTLVELLTVIAIIGILAAILVPATHSARRVTQRAATKVTFGQWVAALQLFHQEYGFYPAIDGGTGKIDPTLFAGALTGRNLDGSAVSADEQLCGNGRLASFYSISENVLNGARTALVDAFGNTEIAYLCDRNGDGRITSADGAAVAVRAAGSGLVVTPSNADLNLDAGIRAEVIFYSAGAGSDRSDLVCSWK